MDSMNISKSCRGRAWQKHTSNEAAYAHLDAPHVTSSVHLHEIYSNAPLHAQVIQTLSVPIEIRQAPVCLNDGLNGGDLFVAMQVGTQVRAWKTV